MSDAIPEAVFAGQLVGLIERYAKDRRRHKRVALALRIAIATSGAAATVLLGWQSPPSEVWFKNIALLFTSAVTLVGAYDAFFEPRKLWVRDTVVLNSLRDLQRRWEIESVTGAMATARVKEYSQTLEEILGKSLNEWVDSKKAP
jgi:hypothetical protein